MKKRGPVVAIIGAALVGIAFLVSYSVMERAGSGLGGEGFFPSPEAMFDEVSQKQTIFPGSSVTFTHTTSASQVPLMWGLYITDYQPDDHVTINATDSLGDKFGSYSEQDPVFIKSFMIPKVDTYNFAVQNTGNTAITAEMMFTEDPQKSRALNDPNSPFNKNIVPLAAAGFMLIFGIIMLVVGIVLLVVDWRKGRNQSRYI